ncbi:MAG: phosphopantetheine-binding protein [Methanosarcinaceae archaeon]|nr:phosphopantetheine-binding protein [Methanosarcinaceae archaeon]
MGSDHYVAPWSQTEEKLLRILSDVIGVNQISVMDDFFQGSGDSLQIIQVYNRIKSEFEINLPMKLLFETPTVRDLALIIDYIQSRK